ncbi:MAG: Hsp20/alpha crystallin family protein [Candidatus Pacearchaeota archaeon]
MVRDIFDEIFEKMARLRRELELGFERFEKEMRVPMLDLRETENELIASIEMPGIDKKDIELILTEDSLEVKAEKKKEAKVEKEGYIKAERAYKGFHRFISLPVKIIPEQASASYKDGILEVRMPKAEKKKVKKGLKVEIK